ncbi:class I SAM-dependent methyltransferase [Ferruginibacter albus]|uniref:class I SAM-dependent methyltransferase n=1 Tax=Ferruginibacter albus TaxID=2875540 RepID=UPI001CC5679D|nr:class I SAM-dependent methyltransferase [Ferruginibacter albus]UAY53120.1 class I SAM-dependent methyltransferase [Ferruginibacter albus]
MKDPEFNPSLFHPYYFTRKGLLKKITQYSSHMTGDVLDFGCGTKPYQSLFTKADSYVGVDFENEGHSHKNEQIEYYYDGKTLPFNKDTFDSIFSSEVFEHVFNLDEMMLELNRVLKPGGKILITCPFVWPEHEIPNDYARYTQFALKSKFEKNGFDIVVIDKSGNFFTAIWQMQQVYLSDVFFPKLTFPILIKIAKFIAMPILTITGIVLSKIFPGKKYLYLNNIIIAEKRN